MDAELEPIYLQITQAGRPEDLFGNEDVILPAETLLKFLAKRYEKLKAITDPKGYMHPEDAEAAREADQRLHQLYGEAQDRAREYVYGIKGAEQMQLFGAKRSFEVGRNRYYIGPSLSKNEQHTFYQGFLERDARPIGEVVLKLINDAADNHLAHNEARILDFLHEDAVPQWKHLPFLIDRFQAGGRVGLVFRKISGFTLTHVRQHQLYQDGVDQKHMVWMLDRMLSCLGYVHRQGIVHGDLNPDNLLLQPKSHNVVLSGWSTAVHKPAISQEKVYKVSEMFSAPEIKQQGEVGPWSDIYSVGKLMIWMLGGDPEHNVIPTQVEEKVQRFLLSLVADSHLERPSDAWELYAEENEIKDSLWPRRFLHFEMS